jgi:photosystem II stability/assembly factor-like uncharacterized protein
MLNRLSNRTANIALLCLAVVVFLSGVIIVVRQNNSRRGGSTDEVPPRLKAAYAYQAYQWYNDVRSVPTGEIPSDWREKALDHIKKYNLRNTAKTSSLTWQSVGPNNIGGRIRSIAIDPNNSQIIYCGSVSGGIWKSANGGTSWFPLSDFVPNLVIGTIVLDPTNPNIIYAGTGEGYFNVDALRGIGVLKSTDGGNSWTVMSNFLNATSPYYFYFINKLVIRPDNPQTLYAAAIGGVWRTTNAGLSWTRILTTPTTRSSFCTDLVADPINPDIMYASFGLFSTQTDGVYKTTNGGTSWTLLSNGFPARSTKFGRIGLAISKSNPSILYACLADSNYYTHSIQKTTDGGGSWFAVSTPFDSEPLINGAHLGGQGWYNNVITVHPTDQNTVFTGGINMFKSTNGGTNWSKISSGFGPPYMHVDHHAIAFEPNNSSTVYFGNDGGMFKTTNGGASFLELNNGLVTTQFYSGAVHPTQEIFYGGTQDNGTLKSTTSPSWRMVLGGDGGVTAVDYNNPNNVYTEYVYLSFRRSTDGGTTWSIAMEGIPKSGNGNNGTSERCAFIAPYEMDPSNPQVFVAGTYRVFRTTNSGLTWSAISNDLSGDGAGNVGGFGSVITALAFAKDTSTVIYAGTSGSSTSASRTYVTTNLGTTWSNITRANLPNRAVTSIAVDHSNFRSVYIGYSGYSSNTPTTPGHVFFTSNKGTAWSNVSGDLPDIPVNDILLDPDNRQHLLVATDIGIFETSNGGTNWVQQNNGMANVAVFDLNLRQDRYVFAATHGRGMFKSSTPFDINPSYALTVSIHQNPVLTRFVDVYVVSNESLAAVPTAQVVFANEPSVSLLLEEQSRRVFRGRYEFSGSGTLTINVLASDSAGNTLSTSRTFQAQLLKPGGTTTVHSHDGYASLQVNDESIDEEMYATIIPYEGEVPSIGINASYTFGPQREFHEPLTITMKNAVISQSNVDISTFSIYRQTPAGWTPLKSYYDPEQNVILTSVTSLGTFALGVNEQGQTEILPKTFTLEQNFPNPFNPVTSILYSVNSAQHVRMQVFDVAGREITTLVNERKSPGVYTTQWDASEFASGVYLYRLQVGNVQQTKKMILLR